MTVSAKHFVLTCGVAALMTMGGSVATSEPAQAQTISIGGFGINIGGLMRGGYRVRSGGGGGGRHSSHSSKRSKDKDSDDSSSSSSSDDSSSNSRKERTEKKDKVLASKG